MNDTYTYVYLTFGLLFNIDSVSGTVLFHIWKYSRKKYKYNWKPLNNQRGGYVACLLLPVSLKIFPHWVWFILVIWAVQTRKRKVPSPHWGRLKVSTKKLWLNDAACYGFRLLSKDSLPGFFSNYKIFINILFFFKIEVLKSPLWFCLKKSHS